MTNNEYFHTPIMVEQVLELLNIQPGGIYVDATCGEGGHSAAILERESGCRLICIDRDESILAVARERLSHPSIQFFNRTFDSLTEILNQLQIPAVNGILADLGISMYHLKQEGRGFSYTDEQSLDMRLDNSQFFSVSEVVNSFKEQEIADIIYKFGEERFSRRIARAIVENRPFQNANQLAKVVLRAAGSTGGKQKHGGSSRIHPATRTFQALRIYVNRELELVEKFIPQAVDSLRSGGRLVMISFHSLEDRIVKWAFRRVAEEGKGVIVTKKPLTPDERETVSNPASRSAKLRCLEKL